MFTGGSVTTSVTSIVAKTIYLSGGATVTIGSPSLFPLSFSLPGGLQRRGPGPSRTRSPTFTGAGGDGIYTWTASNLPTGLTMDAGTRRDLGYADGRAERSRSRSRLSDALGDDVATQTFTLDDQQHSDASRPSVRCSRGQDAVNQNITINGTGFLSGAVASFSGTGITVNSTTFNSATKVTANIDIAAGATTGARDVTVTNPDTGTGHEDGRVHRERGAVDHDCVVVERRERNRVQQDGDRIGRHHGLRVDGDRPARGPVDRFGHRHHLGHARPRAATTRP